MNVGKSIREMFDRLEYSGERSLIFTRGFMGPVAEDVIVEVEKLLGFRIPESFRVFIALYGQFDDDYGLRGIHPGLPFELGRNPYVMAQSYQEYDDLPKDLLVVYKGVEELGGVHVLDCRDHANPDPPVRFWDTNEKAFNEYRYWDNFIEFLRWMYPPQPPHAE
jgi:hypothetical protein